MKQVVQNARGGRLALREVPAPLVRPGHVLVRTRASLISAGTERMVIRFARQSLAGKARSRPDLVRKVLHKTRRDGVVATARAVLARLDEPLPLGYSAAGEVIAVGGGLEGAFQVGQRVAVAGAGLANHADLNVVPRNLAAPVPANVTDEEACFATLAAIAMHGVRNTGATLGDTVAVIGVGLVGQIAVQLLALAGVRPIAVDVDQGRLELARQLGAETIGRPDDPTLWSAVVAMTGGRGCDAVLIAAATETSVPLDTAASIARDRATVVVVGMTGTAFSYPEFMRKELRIVVSRSYGPGRYDADYEARGTKYPEGWVRWTETENLAECLRLMSLDAPRRLDVAALTSHRFPIAEAEAAYRLVVGGNEPCLGVVLTYPNEEAPPSSTADRPALSVSSVPRAKRAHRGRTGKPAIGVIGAGAFARSVLLPELKRSGAASLRTLVTLRGTTADHGREMFGFEAASTDPEAVLEDGAIDGVIIATRHDSHAALATAALDAGKSVLVEKPLALDRSSLNQVVAARNRSDGFLQIGFNRRFAPMAVTMRDRMAQTTGPHQLVIRVNAGSIDADSWIHAADEGGGRIVGEVCHFVDLARFLVGAPIVSVHAEAPTAADGPCDDVSVTLRFEDGSLATIAYTALGDPTPGKERVEAFSAGRTLTLDNFNALTIAADGRVTTATRGRRDKGVGGSLAAFIAALSSGGPAPIDEAELIETSLATLAVLESLRAGRRIDL